MLIALLLAAAASGDPASVIRVVGHGVARTTPDVATVTFTLRGEGKTSDDALRALLSTRTKVDAILGGAADVRTGRPAVEEVRAKACDAGDNDDIDGKPRLSTGDCSIVGYIATLPMTAKIRPIGEAGTIVGLVARGGGVDPRISAYDIADPAVAREAATSAAVADARRQAQSIAAASGTRLGGLRRVEDERARSTDAQDIVVTAAAAPPEVSPAPIVVALRPEPIETTADLIVEFAVEGR